MNKINFKKLVIEEFDLNEENKYYDPYLPKINENHNIILLVGDSGSGKSSYLKEMNLNYSFEFDNRNESIIEILSKISNYNDAKKTLQKFKLNSIPTWLQKFDTLSNGEKLRFELCYKYLTQDIIIIDEFTSMIDRFTAFTICRSIANEIDKKFILATCHHDIINVLKPSCVIDFNRKKIYECDPNLEEVVNTNLDNNIDEVGTYGIKY